MAFNGKYRFVVVDFHFSNSPHVALATPGLNQAGACIRKCADGDRLRKKKPRLSGRGKRDLRCLA